MSGARDACDRLSLDDGGFEEFNARSETKVEVPAAITLGDCKAKSVRFVIASCARRTQRG